MKLGSTVYTAYGQGKVVQNVGGPYPWLVVHKNGLYEQFAKRELKKSCTKQKNN